MWAYCVPVQLELQDGLRQKDWDPQPAFRQLCALSEFLTPMSLFPQLQRGEVVDGNTRLAP